MCRSATLLACLPGWLVLLAEQPAVNLHPDALSSYEAAYRSWTKATCGKRSLIWRQPIVVACVIRA